MHKELLRFKQALVVLISLFIFSATVWPASRNSVTGIVRDQNGDIVEGAVVQVKKLDNGWSITTKTDRSGRYELKGLSPGEYRFSVYRAGFSTAARSVEMPANGAIIVLDFLLVPGVITDTVTITAGKGSARVDAEIPQTVTVTGASETEMRRPSASTQALEGLPSVTMLGANPLASRLRLRGLTSNRLLIIVDGERLNNVRTDPASGISPAVVDVTQLKSVEVLSGSGSSLYGSDALAGTINFITKEPVTSNGGIYLGLRFDGDTRSNGFFWRGANTFNLSTSRIAVRASGTLFRLDNYSSGNEGIPLSEVVRIGNFAALMSNAVNTGVARSFAVWQLPPEAEIPNGQARGFYSQLDVWLFATPKRSIRYRQLSNQHKDIGFSFLSPPYDLRLQSNGFRRLDKYGLRYEGHELESWMTRLTVGFYGQKYSFSDDNLNHSIDIASSWQPSSNQSLPLLTGNASTFRGANLTNGKNSVTTYSADAQVTIIPFRSSRLTTGISYLHDVSVDSFSRVDLSSTTGGMQRDFNGRASTPDSVYKNLSWSSLLEYDPLKRLRLQVGLRFDNWSTLAKSTQGFPLGTETAILNASFAALSALPGGVDVQGVGGIRNLLDGSEIRTNRTSVTGSAGIMLRLPGSVNPYFRWETSYREPGITERYILRNFGERTFSLLLVPNTVLKPERGNIYEIGLKIQRSRWRASLNYFRNNLSDFIGNEFSPTLFVPPDPENGLDPISPSFPFHGVLYVQRANTARARIQGVESNYEVSLSLNKAGSITPFGSLAFLQGSNLTPDQQTLALIRDFYNRPDTPLLLRGSAKDVPMPGISPLSGFFGVRYSDRQGNWAGEYDVRYRARVSRVDPTDLTTAISTQYGSFASLRPSLTQSLRASYSFRREKYRMLLAAGVDNLTGRLYFEPFHTAPAPGRSFVFGLTLEGFDLLRR